jgi:hypothetical protein
VRHQKFTGISDGAESQTHLVSTRFVRRVVHECAHVAEGLPVVLGSEVQLEPAVGVLRAPHTEDAQPVHHLVTQLVGATVEQEVKPRAVHDAVEQDAQRAHDHTHRGGVGKEGLQNDVHLHRDEHVS